MWIKQNGPAQIGCVPVLRFFWIERAQKQGKKFQSTKYQIKPRSDLRIWAQLGPFAAGATCHDITSGGILLVQSSTSPLCSSLSWGPLQRLTYSFFCITSVSVVHSLYALVRTISELSLQPATEATLLQNPILYSALSGISHWVLFWMRCSLSRLTLRTYTFELNSNGAHVLVHVGIAYLI